MPFWKLSARRVLAAGCAALLIGGVAGSGANAQTADLPGDVPGGDDPVAQMMLAGEAGAVANFLGISTDQLRQELTGRSLAEVAQQHGKSADEVTNVVVTTADQQLDTAVSQGQLSSQAAWGYRAEIGMVAPSLVRSADASALALQAVNN
ncbi:MAG: hypothetical protein JO023_15495 [Chloroflexi bacterium]|nr:hypothetical protein [Chloroflexota bacterium]